MINFFVNTPVVEITYSFLQEPSQYNKYEATALFDKRIPEHNNFLQMLKAELAKIGGNFLPCKASKNDPNIIEVKLSQAASVSKGGKQFSFQPKLFDVNAVPIVDLPRIGNGTKGSFNIEVREYNMGGKHGFRLNPAAFQIIEFVEYKSNGNSNNPFENKGNSGEQTNPFAASDGYAENANPFGSASNQNSNQAQNQVSNQMQQQFNQQPQQFQQQAPQQQAPQQQAPQQQAPQQQAPQQQDSGVMNFDNFDF